MKYIINGYPYKYEWTSTQLVNNDDLKGANIRLMLCDDSALYKKNRFVHAVVKRFIQQNPTTTFAQLKSVFPKELLKPQNKELIIERDLLTDKDIEKPRYFLKENEILISGDGVRFAVSTQWDFHNLPNILNLIKSFGWTYTLVKIKR